MKKGPLILLTIALLFSSCKKSKNTSCNEPDLNCGDIMCFAHWDYFDFTLVDKQTGEDLLFDPNPRYTTDEVKLYFDAARTYPINIIADNNKQKLICMRAKKEMYLEIKGNTVYKITADFKAVDCCSTRVKTLSLDAVSICGCCNDMISLPVN